jgi:hypothetical protein
MSQSRRTLLAPASTIEWLRESNDLLAELTVALARSGGNSGRKAPARKSDRKKPHPKAKSPRSSGAKSKSPRAQAAKPRSRPRKKAKRSAAK